MNRKGRPRIEPSAVKKILLIRLRRIGDIILTTPALSVLRENFPDAHLSYVVESPYQDLVRNHPDLDQTVVIPEKTGSRDFLRLIRYLRKEKYDVVLDFHCGPRASLITFLSGAKTKIGYKIKYRNFVYDAILPRSPQNGYYHSVESHLNLVKALGASVKTLPPLSLPRAKKEEKEKIKKIREQNSLVGCKVVVLHISAGNEFRSWGVGNLVGLAKLLSRHRDVKIVLIGAEEDRKAEQEILRENPAELSSLVGKLNLRELRELILGSSLFVGPDSGPMHMAASTSTPMVVYFGPTLPANFSPWQAEASVIEKEFDCRPCPQKRCVHHDFRCLRSIKPEEVYQACLSYIE
ncbi:MAG: glycosyltransferase family 9 protein [Candidatus Aminicenantes bacterium]